MKNNVFKRYQSAKYEISTQLYWAHWKQAKDIKYNEMREKVLSHCSTKNFPQKYKDELMAILDFCYQREISNKFVFPVLWNGRLYSKWDNMPDECREALRKADTEQALKMRPFPVHGHHFTEGMECTIEDK